MTEQSVPLLVFDFDGVLVDGMAEYWWSARRAAMALVPDLSLPEQAPAGFAKLRPQIHKGWEMVLMAAELGRPDLELAALVASYQAQLEQALLRWGLSPDQLQGALERVRSEAIGKDLPGWLRLHHFYPGVLERLQQLACAGSPWAVLTTKGGEFARQILQAAGLEPWALFGHEQGSKCEVLAQLLASEYRPIWFVEDRRPTLELVRSQAELAAVRCFLVSWGYLAPGDHQQLPDGIHWLEPEIFAAPLAQWP
ncbi:HAD family hydrolase [Cyanobium sp. WAJ14-Wanaka]|uniref:HAD family hydrolase n=1 Tax=Cyanobium sp. WAJ14-Wanaka TaxID=2823725 RepID=UPI0020CE7746|nr:HAD family hydrolase [Cyanobium sp. WAJ14-Wanaka]MCP9776024.1 HAD family hydrolase [Cyanobium sp. WAJ14-Wanaka]